MTSHSIGYLLGSLTLGLMFDRLDKLLLVLFPLVGIGVTLAIIPWCAPYGLMIVIHWFKGLFSGGLDAGMCIISSPGRRPWELMVWRSVRPSVRPASTFSFKRLLLKNH